MLTNSRCAGGACSAKFSAAWISWRRAVAGQQAGKAVGTSSAGCAGTGTAVVVQRPQQRLVADGAAWARLYTGWNALRIRRSPSGRLAPVFVAAQPGVKLFEARCGETGRRGVHQCGTGRAQRHSASPRPEWWAKARLHNLRRAAQARIR